MELKENQYVSDVVTNQISFGKVNRLLSKTSFSKLSSLNSSRSDNSDDLTSDTILNENYYSNLLDNTIKGMPETDYSKFVAGVDNGTIEMVVIDFIINDSSNDSAKRSSSDQETIESIKNNDIARIKRNLALADICFYLNEKKVYYNTNQYSNVQESLRKVPYRKSNNLVRSIFQKDNFKEYFNYDLTPSRSGDETSGHL